MENHNEESVNSVPPTPPPLPYKIAPRFKATIPPTGIFIQFWTIFTFTFVKHNGNSNGIIYFSLRKSIFVFAQSVCVSELGGSVKGRSSRILRKLSIFSSLATVCFFLQIYLIHTVRLSSRCRWFSRQKQQIMTDRLRTTNCRCKKRVFLGVVIWKDALLITQIFRRSFAHSKSLSSPIFSSCMIKKIVNK